VVTLQGSYSMLLAPSTDPSVGFGSSHEGALGVRLRPFGALHKDQRLGGVFVDGNVGYVRTGDLNRLGFDFGLGYNAQVTPGFAMGPVVRYGQILQPDGLDNPDDAQSVSLGLNLAFGTGPRAEAPPVVEAPECPPATPATPVVCPDVTPPCPDFDHDGTCDIDDRCPTQAGPPATRGCRVDPCTGAPLVVLVQFQYDSAGLPTLHGDDPKAMDPVLDAVAGAIAQDPTCRVCVMGFASEEGAADYNQALSVRRADAVEDYLVARGVKESRLPTKGFGASCQLVPEDSREMNRRVEFVRLPEGGSCPSVCTE